MIPLFAMALAFAAPADDFPEQVPGMVEACLEAAVEAQAVTLTPTDHKYICTDAPAERFWRWLEAAKVPVSELDVGEEGHWLGRYFPLGGCFKRVRHADGAPAASGLSCSIWVPRVKSPAATADPAR